MGKYLVVLSRDPDENRSVEWAAQTAQALAKRQHEVHFYLIENGVFAAKRGRRRDVLQPLVEAKVKVYAEDISLKVRGLNDGLRDALCRGRR